MCHENKNVTEILRSSEKNFWTIMMTSSYGNIFRVTGPLCGEFTGNRWIPLTKASDAELWCFLWSVPWIKGWVNNRKAGDLRRHRAHYEVIVMLAQFLQTIFPSDFPSFCFRFHWNSCPRVQIIIYQLWSKWLNVFVDLTPRHLHIFSRHKTVVISHWRYFTDKIAPVPLTTFRSNSKFDQNL